MDNFTSDSLAFLKDFPEGPASLFTHSLDSSARHTVDGLAVSIIQQRCPLLACSFESGQSSGPKASLQVFSLESTCSFLRYCYTGDCVHGLHGNHHSLLVLCELLTLANHYQCPELWVQAHANIFLVFERACSFPFPPKDLVAAIRYIFAYLDDDKSLIETVLHYCVSRFSQHLLGHDQAFRELANENGVFHRALAKVHWDRDLECQEMLKLPGPKTVLPPVDQTDHGFDNNLWTEPTYRQVDGREVTVSSVASPPVIPSTIQADGLEAPPQFFIDGLREWQNRPRRVNPQPEGEANVLPQTAGPEDNAQAWINDMSGLTLDETPGDEAGAQAGPSQQTTSPEKARGKLPASSDAKDPSNDNAEGQTYTVDQSTPGDRFSDGEYLWGSDSEWSLISNPA